MKRGEGSVVRQLSDVATVMSLQVPTLLMDTLMQTFAYATIAATYAAPTNRSREESEAALTQYYTEFPGQLEKDLMQMEIVAERLKAWSKQYPTGSETERFSRVNLPYVSEFERMLKSYEEKINPINTPRQNPRMLWAKN